MEEDFKLSKGLTKDILRVQDKTESTRKNLKHMYGDSVPLLARIFKPGSLLWNATGLIYTPGFWLRNPLNYFQERFGAMVIYSCEVCSRYTRDDTEVALSRGNTLETELCRNIDYHLNLDECRDEQNVSRIHLGIYQDLATWIRRLRTQDNSEGLGIYKINSDGSIYLAEISRKEFVKGLHSIPKLEEPGNSQVDLS
jgi:hypothetical protein